MKVRSHLPLSDLERLERAESDAAQSKRLRIIILALHGYTAPAVAMSRRICQRWLQHYNEFGITGLEGRVGGIARGGSHRRALGNPVRNVERCERSIIFPTNTFSRFSLWGKG